MLMVIFFGGGGFLWEKFKEQIIVLRRVGRPYKFDSNSKLSEWNKGATWDM